MFFDFQNPVEKIQFYIQHRIQRENQILHVLETNQHTWYSNLDLVKIIYKETPEQLWKAAARNVLQHLRKLKKERRVESKVTGQLEHEESCQVWKYL